jgi:DNA-binding response OmpR family regulator
MPKVFIIEDDTLLLRMLERVFTFEHFEVEKATDGADALAKLITMDVLPAVVILDIMIPVLSGMEVLKKIKEIEKTKNIPVVILTNLSPGRENAEKTLEAGAALCLLKSQFTPSEVVQKIRALIPAA